MRWLAAIILYSLAQATPAWGDEIFLHIGAHEVRAKIANTPSERKAGLMHSTHLCGNCGMLFVFPQAGKYNFWMQDTPLSLSIAFIAADGSILNVDEMQANTTQTHAPLGSALYALEMNPAWFAARAIKANDHVHGLQHAPRGR